jgi:hypothetical protein
MTPSYYACYAIARRSENARHARMTNLVAPGATASERPPVAAGLFQVLALKGILVYHLIRLFNFLDTAALAKH